MAIQSDIISAVLAKLTAINTSKKALIGFDGYVDRIQRPIASQDKEADSYFPSLEEFGKHISNASGLSTQVTLKTDLQKLGGNGPIMANALAHLSIKNVCMGPFGVPDPDPVFNDMHADSKLISLGIPAQTNALEFADGKLILSEVSPFKTLDWNQLIDNVSLNSLTTITSSANLIVLVDWSNMPCAGDIWTRLLERIILPNSFRPLVFFDLADPGKRSEKEILDVLELISIYGSHTQVILGLNKNEAILVYESLFKQSGATLSTLELTAQIFKKLSIAQLVVHPIDSCCVCSHNGSFHLKGRYLSDIKISTGGGDNFNAGYCFAMLQGFTEMEAMAMAIAVSGTYVQSGASPNLREVAAFLNEWKTSLNRTVG